MAGLGPATHVFLADADEEDVDGRATPGHDSGIDESLSTSVGIIQSATLPCNVRAEAAAEDRGVSGRCFACQVQYAPWHSVRASASRIESQSRRPE